nr:MAG TPA: hypothetical protein [Caudoviricetes sp.]
MTESSILSVLISSSIFFKSEISLINVILLSIDYINDILANVEAIKNYKHHDNRSNSKNNSKGSIL